MAEFLCRFRLMVNPIKTYTTTDHKIPLCELGCIKDFFSVKDNTY